MNWKHYVFIFYAINYTWCTISFGRLNNKASDLTKNKSASAQAQLAGVLKNIPIFWLNNVGEFLIKTCKL